MKYTKTDDDSPRFVNLKEDIRVMPLTSFAASFSVLGFCDLAVNVMLVWLPLHEILSTTSSHFTFEKQSVRIISTNLFWKWLQRFLSLDGQRVYARAR